MAKSFLIRSLMLVLVSAQAVAVQVEPVSKKQAVWSRFREAFIGKDFAKLAELTNFPITVQGNMDEDPSFQLQRDRFSSCFALIYSRETGLGDGLNHLQFIQKNRDLGKILDNGKPISQYGPSHGFRIADLEFSDSTFKLSRFYLDTTDPAVRKRCK